MMYIFRGRESRTKKWVYGSLLQAPGFCCILEDEDVVNSMDYPYLDGELGVIDGNLTPVDPDSIGMFIQRRDKNNQMIFEGDIVKTKYGRLCVVTWFDSRMHAGWDLEVVKTRENVRNTSAPDAYDMWASENLEVVGNIHDNPEMLRD